jgi:serine/threonine protein kinase
MFKLVSEADVIPRSLYITDVSMSLDSIGAGGYARVRAGKYQGNVVALKVIEKQHKDVSAFPLLFVQNTDVWEKINLEFCQEALAWRSYSHPYILPLLGIFKEKSHLFLVSPYMAHGTLANWREKNDPPVLSEIHRLVRLQCLSEWLNVINCVY